MHLLPALALFLLLPAAHAAEVSPALQVEASPGLTPEAVRRVFDQQRQKLASCLRLRLEGDSKGDKPGSPGEVDDRILLAYSVGRDGKVRSEERRDGPSRFEGLYLDTDCAGPVVRAWTFPSFPGRERDAVRVEILARFSTTAAERKAALGRIQADFEAVCRTLSALGGGKLPTPEDREKALQRFLTERRSSLHPRVVELVEGEGHGEQPEGTGAPRRAV